MNALSHNVDQWLANNKNAFLPPICNKMMHNDQLKVFYVGGPNKRLDFHLEEGEELFYMHKGSLTLKVLANDKFQDITVKEGEIFLLPARIPHSPQRDENTIGLVIERERLLPQEQDCVRYYVNDSSDILYEHWFHCVDLGSQLAPLIKQFFASEQYRTGKPIPGTITNSPPFHADVLRKLELPINLQDWLRSNEEEIHRIGWKRLYGTPYETDVIVYGRGQHAQHTTTDTFLWQLAGSATAVIASKAHFLTSCNDTVLVRKGNRFILNASESSLTMAVIMDPGNKTRTLHR